MATIGIVALAYFAGDWHGAHVERKSINAELAHARAEAVDQARTKERELQRAISKLQLDNDEVTKNAKIQTDSLRADVRRGAVRLSIATSGHRPTCGDTGVASGTGDQERADILPEVADALVGIATDADSEVRRTNLCIDSYNALSAILSIKGK
ncbi:lysis system i-spanin subunit Rz [Undibacterium sp. Di26W]|uniref:lysis system i-spanin subunit Rz n=1 Tax=Undibacterium sp. Di26W TaxID=3413035 RepID=UPI003BF1F87F